jgi:hypothetical protein
MCSKGEGSSQIRKIKIKPLTIILDDSHIDSHVDLDTEGGFLPYMLRTNFVLVSFLYLTRLMYLKNSVEGEEASR